MNPPAQKRMKPGSNRARKDAAKQLALALQQRYRRLVEANGGPEDEIVIATADLAQCMYENVEFTINVLRAWGGLEAKFEPLTSPNAGVRIPASEQFPAPANDLPDISALTTPAAPTLDLKCQCPPLEPGIIGNRHMTSCPEFRPH